MHRTDKHWRAWREQGHKVKSYRKQDNLIKKSFCPPNKRWEITLRPTLPPYHILKAAKISPKLWTSCFYPTDLKKSPWNRSKARWEDGNSSFCTLQRTTKLAHIWKYFEILPVKGQDNLQNTTQLILITGLPVAQPSYKMGLVFSYGTKKSLSGVLKACAKYRRMRKIRQGTSEEYILRSSNRLEAIYFRWKHNAKNTNANTVDGKPTVKDGKSTFWKWYSSWTIRETHLQANSSEWILSEY